MNRERTLGQLARGDFVAFEPDVPLEDAAERLAAAGIDAAVVVDREQRPLGTIGLAQCLARRPGVRVGDRMTRPATTGTRDSQLRAVAADAAGRAAPLVVAVDAAGRAVGVATALELLSALVLPTSATDAALLRHPHTDAAFTELESLSLDQVGQLPPCAGVIALVRGGQEVHETLVWSEETANLQRRLVEMVSQPEHETPQLARLLTQCHDLRFRAAAIADAPLRRQTLDGLRSGALRVARPSL
jgi:CBS domain-containing protein